jgi:hypothetical protein
VDADDHPWLYQQPDQGKPGYGRSLVVWVDGEAQPTPEIPFARSMAPVYTLANRHVLVRSGIGVMDLVPGGPANDPKFQAGPMYDLETPSTADLRSSFATSEVHGAARTTQGMRIQFFTLP